MKKSILIVGMARSGTTVVAHLLGSSSNVHVEIEPHMLWKHGDFNRLSDERHYADDKATAYIRNRLLNRCGNKQLVEKSPPNSLRPHFVHDVFPDGKVVYVVRDPIRCIYSNYKRSVNKTSLNPSIILKKYFRYSGKKDLPGAVSSRSIFAQIQLKEIPLFLGYFIKLMRFRRSGSLPFGPKIDNFDLIVNDDGLLAYHVQVYLRSLEYMEIFTQLYGDNFFIIKFEDLISIQDEARRLFDFCDIKKSNEEIHLLLDSLDKTRIQNSLAVCPMEDQIRFLIQKPTEK